MTIFFVLSGFVLSFNYFDELRGFKPARLYDYFVARFARVYPLYVLILFYFVVRQHALGESIEGWWHNALAIQAWNPDLAIAYSFDPPSWSIGVEFFLYACFPLLIPLVARLRGPRQTLIAAGGVALAMIALVAWFVIAGKGNLSLLDPDSAHRWLYRMPLTRLGDFALGVLAAQLFVQTRGQASVRRIGRPLAWVAGLTILVLMAWPALYYTAWSWDVAYALPAVALIFGLAVAPFSLPARVLSLPFVVLLGEASYAFYLVHSPAIGFFGGGFWAAAMSPTALVYEALTLGAIIALAVGLHVTIELPARKYLRRLLSSRRRSDRAPVSPPEPAGQPQPAAQSSR